mmetsp:Transcript_52024/g.123868  ORF Transcript_52024/g.123868 Transcript_52024/m.123868 type:complete len:543 (+) Transcript_52024:107-1735(+)
MTSSDAAPAPPPVKRARRSTSDLIKSLQSRRSLETPAGAEAPARALQSYEDESVAKDYTNGDDGTEQDERFTQNEVVQRAARVHEERVEEARQALLEEKLSKQLETDVLLLSNEDITLDLTLKASMKLSSPNVSMQWLRSIPPALWAGKHADAAPELERSKALQKAVAAVCERTLTQMAGEPVKAAKWMTRISSCLSWHEVDGLALPPAPKVPTEDKTSEVKAQRRQVSEWDQAYRGLQALLRQGLVNSYAIVSERFSVFVLGEGTGPVKRTAEGEPKLKPTSGEPCAILCPSQDEIRRLLQDNHVDFEIAPMLASEAAAAASSGPVRRLRRVATGASANSDTDSMALVPQLDDLMPADLAAEAVTESLSELRRDGEKVVFMDNGSSGAGAVTSRSSALLFEGSRRVHALLDVLRQLFLGGPLYSLPAGRPKLPRLLAPGPFRNSKQHSADVVVRTQTVNGQKLHTAELQGVFFPKQVKLFLELLRVAMHSYACDLAVEERHSAGINAFCDLGSRCIARIECASCGKAADGTAAWGWKFVLS